MSDLKLVIFDVDGTLVDSQGDITAAMDMAFRAQGLTPPDRNATLSIVGLSLPEAMLRLAPDHSKAVHDQLVEGYKDAYVTLRARNGAAVGSPLYPGVRQVLDDLSAQDDVLLAVATGKSRRGLDKLIEGHGLEGMFFSQQVSDFHPSKPHPSMILTAMSDCGVGPAQAVMIGDTTYDMDMARAAGVTGIGVSWGYHDRAELGAAAHILDDIAGLPALLDQIWGQV
jgi:phosphoglycolate phosphatase